MMGRESPQMMWSSGPDDVRRITQVVGLTEDVVCESFAITRIKPTPNLFEWIGAILSSQECQALEEVRSSRQR